MTRTSLYEYIYHISDALNSLQIIGEETMDFDENEELPEDINLQIGDVLLDLEQDIY